MPQNRGQSALIAQVQDQDLCTLCGGCASLCPYFRSWEGRVVGLDQCDLETGRCFNYCPRTELDLEELFRSRFGEPDLPLDIGPHLEVVMARGAGPELVGRVQTGGAVTALIASALEADLITAAILTRSDESLQPQGKVARTAGDVLDCAGSSYISGPTLETLNAQDFSGEKAGLVVLPCQAQTLAKMRLNQDLDKDRKIDRVGLTVGLFCTWALDWVSFSGFLENRFPDTAILSMDITPPPERLLQIRTEDGDQDIPLDQIREFIRPGCKVCLDMTAELVDISVGTVEGTPGWNTVIVRTPAGQEALDRAVAQGAIETRPLPRENLAHLKEAALLKKARALDALEAKGGLDESYLNLDSDYGRRLIQAVKGVER